MTGTKVLNDPVTENVSSRHCPKNTKQQVMICIKKPDKTQWFLSLKLNNLIRFDLYFLQGNENDRIFHFYFELSGTLPTRVWALRLGVPSPTGIPKAVEWVVLVSVLGPAISNFKRNVCNFNEFGNDSYKIFVCCSEASEIILQ